MTGLYSILMAIDVLLAIGVIGLVLIQHGKGADAGAAFGSGASATVFGARGSASFLTRTTAILAALFFINSLGLAYLARQGPAAESIVDKVVTEQPPQIPDESSTEKGPVPAERQGVTSSEMPGDVPFEQGAAENSSGEGLSTTVDIPSPAIELPPDQSTGGGLPKDVPQ